MCMAVCMHVCICTLYGQAVSGDQKKTLDSLELEFQMIVSCCVGAWNPNWNLYKSRHCQQPLSHLSCPKSKCFTLAQSAWKWQEEAFPTGTGKRWTIQNRFHPKLSRQLANENWYNIVQTKMESWVSKDSPISQWTQTWGCVKKKKNSFERSLSVKKMKFLFTFYYLLPTRMKMLSVKCWSPLLGCCLWLVTCFD